MNGKFSGLARYISILDRLMKMYYDHELADFEIGWGQQFYVEYLYEYPGASAQEMVERFRVDKATLTKVIRKLVDIGYVRVVRSEDDRRMKQLYLTDAAVPAVKRVKEIHNSFQEVLSSGLSPEEQEQVERMMEKMVENINSRVWHRMEGQHGE